MRRFAWSEQQFIADIATAVKWKVEEDIETGKPFEAAKAARIKQARATWTYLTPDIRQAVEAVCVSISPADLSKRTHKAVKDRLRADIERMKGKPLGWIDRILFRLTGTVWTI